MSSAGTAYLFDVVRSPRGKARAEGGLAQLKPQELVRQLCASLDTRLDDEVCGRAEALLLGCVGQVGAQGGNIALVSKLHSGLPDTAAAYTLNNYCVSSLTAIGQAAAMVTSGQVRNALAGGVEMMSRVPFMADAADYYTDATMPARSRYIPVALAADRLAEDEGIDRAALDACALRSQQRAAAAETNAALTRSRVPMTRPDGSALAVEECVRPQTTAASLAAMQPAFAELANTYAAALGRPIDHRHTFAHAPPICDGASLALIGGSDWLASSARSYRRLRRIRRRSVCISARGERRDGSRTQASRNAAARCRLHRVHGSLRSDDRQVPARSRRGSRARERRRRPPRQGSSDGCERRNPVIDATRCARGARCEQRASWSRAAPPVSVRQC